MLATDLITQCDSCKLSFYLSTSWTECFWSSENSGWILHAWISSLEGLIMNTKQLGQLLTCQMTLKHTINFVSQCHFWVQNVVIVPSWVKYFWQRQSFNSCITIPKHWRPILQTLPEDRLCQELFLKNQNYMEWKIQVFLLNPRPPAPSPLYCFLPNFPLYHQVFNL